MPATRISEGNKIDYTPSAYVAAGAVVLQGDLFGIAETDLEADRLGALAVEGIFDITKATTTGSAFAAGADVFWDPIAAVVTNSAAGGANKKIGNAVAAAADGEATVRVKLTPGAA